MMKINDVYSIECNLHKGNYKYTLFANGEKVSSMVDKFLPADLPKKGKLKELLDNINYECLSVGELRKSKNNDINKVIENLEITLRDNEIDFNEYQQTCNKVYNKKSNIVFNFCIIDVEKITDEIIKLKIQNNFMSREYTGSVDDIIKKLNNDYLINTYISNYKFVFTTLIGLVYDKKYIDDY